MAKLDRSDDNDLLLALRHPLRREMLRRMGDGEAISPLELSALLDQPLSNVSYHMRVLAKCGAVTLVRTKPARGSMQHFYRNAIEEPWARQILGLSGDDDDSTGESQGKPST